MVKLFTPDDSLHPEPGTARTELRLLSLAFLILLAAAVALALAPIVRSGSQIADFNGAYFIPLGVWSTAAVGLHLWMRRTLPRHDPIQLPIVMLLAGWGLLVIWRLSPVVGIRQTIWLGLAVAVAAVIIRFSSFIKQLQDYRLIWLITGLLLTGLTLLFGTNPSGAEPDLWFRLMGVYFQPSEPLRLVLVIYLAAYYAKRLHHQDRLSPQNPGTMTPIIIIYALSISLLILQRDLGTAILFAGVLTLMLYLATRRWQIFLAAGGVLLLAGVLGFMLYDVVQVRIEAWLLPWRDPSGTSYQIVQALIAFASGGIAGTGPGLGSPGFVPAAHTDFIYTAIGEEFGFVGVLLLISLYIVFLSRGLKTSALQADPFNRMLASGIVITIGLQTLLIMGGNVRLFPLTGVTLPFMSYGGSSLLTSFAAFGLLVCLSSEAETRQADSAYQKVQLGMMSGFTLLALLTCWWSIFKSPSLLNRVDNYRRFVESRFQERGAILDQNGRVLVSTTGEPGSFERSAPYTSFAPLVGYYSNQLGQSGLEQSLDPFLRGLYGYSEAELLWSYMLDSTSPGGLDVRLTLELDKQEEAFRQISGKSGAILFLDSSTGAVLTMVSSPSFDTGNLEDNWDQLINREDAPLLNRAIQASYQPGTSLSPLLLAWELERTGTLPDDLGTDLSKTVHINNLELYCARSIRSANNELSTAVLAGCPQASIELGSSMGNDEFLRAMETFGFTSDLQMRLPVNQLDAPTMQDSLQSIDEAAVGQGNLTISPLRAARAAASLQTGYLPALHIVDTVHLADGSLEQMAAPGSAEQVLSPDAVASFHNLYQLEQNPQLCFSGRAVSGAEMESIAWAICLVQQQDGAVLTVVLENADPADALNLAYVLLNQPAFIAP